VGHSFFVVNGPHVNLDTALVRGSNQRLGYNGNAIELQRNLQCQRTEIAGERPTFRGCDRAGYLARAGTCRQGWPHATAHSSQSVIAKRADEHSLVHFGGTQNRQERLDGTVTFEVKVESLLPKLFQRIDHAHDLVGPSFSLNLSKFAPTALTDQSGGIGDAVESIIVKQHRNPIAGYLHVGFEVAITQADGVRECGSSVFDSFQGATAMGHGYNTKALKVGMTGRHAGEPTQT
jgi:hypothetical protein